MSWFANQRRTDHADTWNEVQRLSRLLADSEAKAKKLQARMRQLRKLLCREDCPLIPLHRDPAWKLSIGMSLFVIFTGLPLAFFAAMLSAAVFQTEQKDP